MKFAFVIGVVSLTTLMSHESRADEIEACIDAAAKGQTLRDDHKLVEAREQFQICNRKVCPEVVQSDCAGWLDAVEKSLPTIIITVKDMASGADRLDVGVLADGHLVLAGSNEQQALVSPLIHPSLHTTINGTRTSQEGIPLNPGLHTFVLDTNDAPTKVVQTFFVREGNKNQSIVLVVPRPPRPIDVVEVPPPPKPSKNWRTPLGWTLDGLGVLSVGIGTAYGFTAIQDKNRAHCNDTDFMCDSSLSGAKSAAVGADIGLAVGSVFIVGGTALLIWPKLFHMHENAKRVLISPWMKMNGGGLSFKGMW